MPTVVIDGYRLRFYSSDWLEPPHVHVLRDEHEAKVWLDPVLLQHNHGYTQSELNRIMRLIHRNRERLLEVWYEYFGRSSDK
ncbi:MAG: DUF4160 domain-containing protein [Chloroflexi bacterium]|nr:DUF4160 domain-containing protein [Chloroflexota bacterium]MCL5275283.1 DUF4160 domain-containing protein [Chloroflexota bacterium]